MDLPRTLLLWTLGLSCLLSDWPHPPPAPRDEGRAGLGAGLEGTGMPRRWLTPGWKPQ